MPCDGIVRFGKQLVDVRDIPVAVSEERGRVGVRILRRVLQCQDRRVAALAGCLQFTLQPFDPGLELIGHPGTLGVPACL